MTTTRLAMLALVLTACGSNDPDPIVDAGTDPVIDAGDTNDEDAGSEPIDAGPEPCEGDAEEQCEGVEGNRCNPGTRYCIDGFWSICDARVQPVAKLCDVLNCADELNAGCECLVGTSRLCYEGPEDTLGRGPCRQGRQTCVATEAGSQWGACENQVLPQPDDCTGSDLDCTGGLPETGCACTEGDWKECGGVTEDPCLTGTTHCIEGAWGPCGPIRQPSPGVCTEESCAGGPNPGCECVVGETEACYTGVFGTEGVGTCAAGTRTCQAPGVWSACQGEVKPVSRCFVENCTGVPHPECE